MAAAVTVSAAGVSYAALDPAKLEAQAQVVADRASCRTVDAAIVAYVALNDAPPRSVGDLAGYVKGDITRYSVAGGVASGPGC
jgi:hypothetical protein